MPYLRQTVGTAQGGMQQRATHHHRLRIPAMSLSMMLRSEERNTCPTLLNSELASLSSAPLPRDFDDGERSRSLFF
jgi:hypothetical protein